MAGTNERRRDKVEERPRSWFFLGLVGCIVLIGSSLAFGVAGGSAASTRAMQRASSRSDLAHRLRPQLVAMMQRHRIPGAIVAIRAPRLGTWVTGLGWANIATGQRMRSPDQVRVGSITKTMTATIILQLAQQGRLRLGEPVSKLWSGVPNGRHVTIRQVLQMTSGLYNYSESLRLNQALDRNPGRHWSPRQLLKIGLSHKPYFAPGKGYHYSNTNYVLLGLIARKLTHHSLGYEFRHRIFAPLGMSHTSFPLGRSLPKPRAQGYQFINNVDSLTAPVLTGKKAAWADWSAANPETVTHANPSWTWAAGQAISTLGDLLRYARPLATGMGLLSPRMQRQRLHFIPTTPNAKGTGYGLGIADVSGFIGHTGQLPGYNSFVGYDPKIQTTVVILVNLNQSPDGTAPVEVLGRLILAELLRK